MKHTQVDETDGVAEQDTSGASSPRRRGRTPWLVGIAIVVVAGVSAVGALGLGGGGSDDASGDRARGGQEVAVVRGTLVEQTTIDGRLGYGPEVPFRIRASGTVTWLPESGETVRRGEPVVRIDDRPVVLLYGSLPMYRTLGMTSATPAATSDADTPEATTAPKVGTTPASATPSPPPRRTAAAPQRGMDVEQFETNLAALGYSGFTVDDSFTTQTAAAVERWQRDLGFPRTGSVEVGDVVYASGAVRVASAGAQVGAPAEGSPLGYTGTARVVTVAAPAAGADWAERGAPVVVDLPDGRSVKGEVNRVGKDATTPTTPDGAGGAEGDAKAPTVSVVITFADQGSLGDVETGPVTVRHVVGERENVLTVPVAALVALAEGGHGLEPVVPGSEPGSGAFVRVETGLFADGSVEVSGPEVREGMKVRIPE